MSVLIGLYPWQLRHITQALSTEATKTVVNTSQIAPVLRQLQRLPVWPHIEFKLDVLVYNALNGLSAQYVADDCQLIIMTGRRRLQSSNVATCKVPRICTSMNDWSFTVTGSHLWIRNTLPPKIPNFAGCWRHICLTEDCRNNNVALCWWAKK